MTNVSFLFYLMSGFLVMTTQTREFPMMSTMANMESIVTMAAWPASETMTTLTKLQSCGEQKRNIPTMWRSSLMCCPIQCRLSGFYLGRGYDVELRMSRNRYNRNAKNNSFRSFAMFDSSEVWRLTSYLMLQKSFSTYYYWSVYNLLVFLNRLSMNKLKQM